MRKSNDATYATYLKVRAALEELLTHTSNTWEILEVAKVWGKVEELMPEEIERANADNDNHATK